MQSTLNPEQERKLIQEAVENLERMRYFRRQYDQRRLYFYRQYIGQRDPLYFSDNVTPRSNTFVPYPFVGVENVVSRVKEAFFSFDPWFEVKPRYAASDQSASRMQEAAHYLLNKANCQNHIETLVRNIAIYGHAAMKVDWDWGFDVVHYAEPIFAQQPVINPMTGEPVINPQTGQPAMQPVINPQTGQPIVIGTRPATKQIPRACPKLIPIDIYDLLIDPDQQIVAHLTERTLGALKREVANNPNLYFDSAVAELIQKVTAANPDQPDGTIIRIAEVWQDFDKSCSVLTFGQDNDAISWKDARAAIRATGLSSFERKCWAGESILLYHGPNPFQHQRIPIVYTNYIKLPNEVFGLGAVEIISDLTDGLNRFVNMVSDNWNLGINHRYAYDIQVDMDHAALNNANTPGGKVGVNGDPTKAIYPLPNYTPSAGDYQIITLYKAILEMTSGAEPYINPTGGEAGATGISQALTGADTRLSMFLDNLEHDVIQPMLEMTASNIMQFLTDQQESLITGEQPAIQKVPLASPEELIGDYEFELVAGRYTTNKVVRQRNMMAFANIIAKSPFLNQYEGLMELGKVMEIPHMERLLKTPQQLQAEQLQGQQQAAAQARWMAELEVWKQEAIDRNKAQVALIPKGATQPPGLYSQRVESQDPMLSPEPPPTGLAVPEGPGQGAGGGAPRTAQFEGSIPGTSYSGILKQLSQTTGSSATGLPES